MELSENLYRDCQYKDAEIIRARIREYSVLSTEALRVLLAARGVYAELDKRNQVELVNLAVQTHDCAGDQRRVNEMLSRIEQSPGPAMVDLGV